MENDEDELNGKTGKTSETKDKFFYSEENGPSLSDKERDSATAAKFYRHQINEMSAKIECYEKMEKDYNTANTVIAKLEEQKKFLEENLDAHKKLFNKELFEKRKIEIFQKLVGTISGVMIGIWKIIDDLNISVIVIVCGIALLIFSLLPSVIFYWDKKVKE